MARDIDNLHHIGLIGPDLDQLAGQYERLGFTLTPLSLPRFPLARNAAPEPVGAGNRHAIFSDNYLELLGVVDHPRWDGIPKAAKGPFDIDRPLARYQGLHVLHLGTNRIEGVRERLERQAFQPLAIRPFQRSVDAPGGSHTMRARAFSLPDGVMPEALFQVAQHDTPELVLQTRYMHHANGARRLVNVIVCVENIAEAVSRYGAIADAPVQWGNATARIALGHADILITDPSGLRELLPDPEIPAMPFLAGFSLIADLGTAKAFFESHKIVPRVFKEMLIIGPEDAGGSYTRFVAATQDCVSP